MVTVAPENQSTDEKTDENRKKAYEILALLNGMKYRDAEIVVSTLSALIKTFALVSVKDEGLVKVGVS